MCDDIADLEWTPLGPVNWGGDVVVLEFCARCAKYRARMLDINEIDVVMGPPDVDGVPTSPIEDAQEPADGAESDAGVMEQSDDSTWTDGDTDRDGDDWLVK